MTDGAEGCGDGRVCYDVPPYIGDIGRVLQVQVGDEEFSIGQPRPGTLTSTATVTATPTPTVSPCVEYEEEQLTFDLDIDPPEPRVGDEVTLTFHVRNTTSGLAGIPSPTICT